MFSHIGLYLYFKIKDKVMRMKRSRVSDIITRAIRTVQRIRKKTSILERIRKPVFLR